MDIMVAMIMTINKIFWFVMEALFYVGVFGFIVLVIGLAGLYYSRWKSNQSVPDDEPETEKAEEPAEKAYVPQPGTRLGISSASDRMWRELDRLNDKKILDNTEEL